MIFGAHMSSAGGVWKALERGKEAGCEVIQLFTKNNNRWSATDTLSEDAEKFRAAAAETGVIPSASHSAYLINLASANPVTLDKSITAFIDEIDRADFLGIPNLIFHPGSHGGAGEEVGIKKIVDSLNVITAERPKAKVKIVLETTAGQGNAIGYKFEHLAEIMAKCKSPDRFGVCLDTCHIFAAGYNITDKEGYKATFDSFKKVIGFELLRAIHMNDSKKECGSNVDRHEHIGKGKIGVEGFRLLVNDHRLQDIPMILETPKGPDMKEDKINLALLRKLAGV
ncbi:MAG: deoxyribonuclease IV [Nitrospinota bacterium]